MTKSRTVLYTAVFACLICLSCFVGSSQTEIVGVTDAENNTFSFSANSNYTTYFGSTGSEDATKVAFDNEGNTLLIGQSQSDDMPTTDGAYQVDRTGGDEPFIAKFTPAGDLVFCTYLGGSQYEHITSIIADADNNIVVGGTTQSTNFPVTLDAYQSTNAGGFDGFLAKFSTDGSELLYSTYFGTAGTEWIYGIDFDASGNYLFSGWTTGTGQATVGVVQTSNGGNQDAFVARLSSNGTSLQMFSYFGGTSNDRVTHMTADSAYNMVISGVTQSDDLPVTSGAFNETYGGGGDAYVAKIAADGSSTIFATYIGGADEDYGIGCDIDSDGNILVSGFTESTDIQILNAVQPTYGEGSYDIFVAKFSGTGTGIFVTYFGGNKSERAWDVRVDNNDDVLVVGRTFSDDFPTVNAVQPTRNGNEEACLVKLSSDGQTILLSTYFGGSSNDYGEGLAVDGEGHVVITGRTSSEDLDITTGAHQSTISGGYDTFICHTTLDYVSDTTDSETSDTNTDTISTDGLPIDDNLLLIVGISVLSVILIIVILVLKKR
ncbi:MAG: SBBP repeat-containing protein [Candidatus Thorarchaeota archaeon]